MRDPKIVHYDDIGFTVRYGLIDQNDLVMDFECYDYDLGATIPPSGERIPTRFYDGECNPTESLDEAELFLEGHVKWDGCSNMYTEEESCWHFCEKQQAVNVGILMGRLYELAESFFGPLD